MARRRRISLTEDFSGDLVLETRSAEPATTGQGADPAMPVPAKPVPAMPAAPIARLAGETAAEQGREIERLREAAGSARALEQAEAEGRVMADVDWSTVDVHYLHRDRIWRYDEDEQARALKASIRENGQRMPVELVRFARETEGGHRYGLISGFRRIATLQRLHHETGNARWSTVRAMIREEGGLAPAFLAMVEENEIRANLSFYERGRVAARAAEQGAFPDPDAAIDALFAAASPAKRSKIRSFLRIVESLGDLLAFPEEISERQGLKIARALRDGGTERFRAGLAESHLGHSRAADEQKVILRLLAEAPAARKTPATGRPPGRPPGRPGAFIPPADAGPEAAIEIAVDRRLLEDGTEVRISGRDLDPDKLDRAFEAVAAIFRE